MLSVVKKITAHQRPLAVSKLLPVSPRIPTLLAFALALAVAAPARAELKPGDAFPSLAASDLTGDIPATAGKIVVVDFCASWCAPCKASFPALGKLALDYAPRGVVVVAISIDEKPAAYAAFVKKMAPPFPVLHDRSQKIVRAVEVPTMPTTYVLGRDGKVAAVHAGFHNDSDQKLRQTLDQLLAAKP